MEARRLEMEVEATATVEAGGEVSLEFPFERDRFRHALVERQGDVCLVKRTNLVTDAVHWEVIVLRHLRGRTVPNGRTSPAWESYPRTEQWGSSGWTYTRLLDAREKFVEVRAGRLGNGPHSSNTQRSSPASREAKGQGGGLKKPVKCTDGIAA
jgi:hypothetical protein